MRNERMKECIRLTLKHNYSKIYDLLTSVKAVTIRKMFKHFYKIINESL